MIDKIEYSKKIDNVIYNKITEDFDGQDFLDLALAALDQWVSPDNHEAVSIIKQLEKLELKRKLDSTCYWCENPIDPIAHTFVRVKGRIMHEDCYQDCRKEIHEKPENYSYQIISKKM